MESIHAWDGKESAHTTSLKSKKIALWKKGELISLRLTKENQSSLTSTEDPGLAVSTSLKKLQTSLWSNRREI